MVVTKFAEVAAIILETEFWGFAVVVITEFMRVTVCAMDSRRHGSGQQILKRM
jgi:hypothetical protein